MPDAALSVLDRTAQVRTSRQHERLASGGMPALRKVEICIADRFGLGH